MVKVNVMRNVKVDDGMGGTKHEFINHLEIYGTLDQLSGDEILASEKIGTLSTHIFIIFQIVDVVRSDRFIIDNKVYDVTDVDNPNNLNRQLEIKLKFVGEYDEV